MKRNWFCRNCKKTFDLTPWESYKNLSITDLNCPYCRSKSIFHGTDLFKAIIDKKPADELLQIIGNYKHNS